jgi:hypothetical protein
MTQPFESFQVSTKTFIVYSNLRLNIEDIFTKNILPITPFVVVKKRRGRKKKVQEEDPNRWIQEGSIIRVQYMKEHHGVILKKESSGYFRNSMTVDIIIDGKRLNFKATRNGKFQLTGCKSDVQAEKAIVFFWDYIKFHRNVYELVEVSHLKVYFDPVMYNIDFSLGFQVNRENLDIYFNTKTPYSSLLETTFGYTGVNIKLPVTTPFKKLKIKCKEYSFGDSDNPKTSYIPYDAFVEKYLPKEMEQKYNTFLVFQSGKVIMSGKAAVFMESAYYEFLAIISQCLPLIREVIA